MERRLEFRYRVYANLYRAICKAGRVGSGLSKSRRRHRSKMRKRFTFGELCPERQEVHDPFTYEHNASIIHSAESALHYRLYNLDLS